MNGLSEKTSKVIQKMFPSEQREEVRQLLMNACGNDLSGFPNSDSEQLEMIHLAVLKLSKGHVDELPLIIIEGQEDWRDLLLASHFAGPTYGHIEWANSYLSSAQPFPLSENEPREAIVYQSDWVKCPQCGWRFCLRNTVSWSGERHRKCGQRIKLITT